MVLPRLLQRLIDPASAEFERWTPRHRPGPVFRQAVVFGPGVPGGAREPTVEEAAELEESAARHRADHEADLADTRRRWAAELSAAAGELLVAGAVTVALDGRTVAARIIRFWHGDSLLATTVRGQDGEGVGESLTRIPRDPHRLPPDALVDYLARAAARG